MSEPLPDLFEDPDLVDRIFDYIVEMFPEMSARELSGAKAAVRAEFAGSETYLRKRRSASAQAAEVLALFNGRNASEIARRLRISRASVYRYIKQAGR